MSSDKPVILMSESTDFSNFALMELESTAEVRMKDLNREQLLQEVGFVDVLWVRLRHIIDGEVMNAGPQIKFIATPTTGLTHIDLSTALEKGIEVVSLKGETEFLREIRATAEHTIALLLGLIRNLNAAAEHVKDGGWNRELFRGSELHNKTAGIVGYGRLGRIVAEYLAAFGVEVLVYDPVHLNDQIENGVRLVDLEYLLANSDIVSLHVNLTPENEKFFGIYHFNLIKEGAIFVNTSRGELIDEDALLNALVSGKLAGAALDVLTEENSIGMDSNKLVEYAKKNSSLLITPHIGGCTLESMHKTEEFLARKLIARLKEETDRV